jgi:hypothetical protein
MLGISFEKKKVKKVLTYFSIFLLSIFILLFIMRNTLLNVAIDKLADKVKHRYHANLSVGTAKFHGIDEIFLHGFLLSDSLNNKIVSIDTIQMDLKFLKIFALKIQLDQLIVKHSKLNLLKKKEVDNFSFFLKSANKGKAENNAEVDSLANNITKWNFSKLANNALDNLFDNIPQYTSISDTEIKFENDSINLKIISPIISIKDDKIFSQSTISENSHIANWKLNGTINFGKRNFNIAFYPENSSAAQLPLLYSLYKLKVSFDTLHLSLNENDYSGSILSLKGKSGIENLKINQWRISKEDVHVKNAFINFAFYIDENTIAIDSATKIALNKIELNPFLKIEVANKSKLNFKLKMNDTKAQDFFESLPNGLFSSFKGIECEGTMAYNLNFEFDEVLADSLIFDSKLSTQKFKIKKYGETNFSKLNSEFLYSAYDKENLVRTFLVGESNPNFTHLENISKTLQTAVLCSEDGDFFWHNGFNERAFRKSIITNYKARRFKRGGSTISMQLVKNVFLTRKKTIARKLEEVLIVWLIEKNRLCSKERMYEVYLNIIEWGPNVYGIAEASKFYFNTTPQLLTLNQSIFLASIVPKPKYFYWQFDTKGEIKPHNEGYFKLIASHLFRREVISEEEKNTLDYKVKLTGIAKEKLKIDSLELIIDSLKTNHIIENLDIDNN